MFPRVDAAFETCRNHLDKTGTWQTEIEQIFVGYLLAIIHAEFEMAVVSAVKSRCWVEHDTTLTSYLASAIGRLVKKIAIGDLTGVLGSFGSVCKEDFSGQVINTRNHAAYDNIIVARQSVAHASGTNMTFDELATTYSDALVVLTTFTRSLNL